MGGPYKEPQNSGALASLLSMQWEARGGVVCPEGLGIQQILILTVIVIIFQVQLMIL